MGGLYFCEIQYKDSPAYFATCLFLCPAYKVQIPTCLAKYEKIKVVAWNDWVNVHLLVLPPPSVLWTRRCGMT